MLRRTLLISSAVALFASSALASTWDIDSAHSSAQFAVKHLMVSTVRGTMGPVTGVAEINESDLSKSTVEAKVDVTGIDTREPKRDAHLKSPDFFDAAKFPTITFKSKSVAQGDGGKYQVVGDLTIRDVTKEVVLEVEGSPTPITDPSGNARLGGVARTRINRQDFGVSFNKALETGGLVVGNEVDITIDVELTKRK